MRILVCCASRHGSTRELADKIASTLRRSAVPGGRALHVDVRDVHEAIDPSRYHAVITGRSRPAARSRPRSVRPANS